MQTHLRILVAENNPDDAFFLRMAFEQAEVRASLNFVRDGQELIDYFRGEAPFNNPVLYPFPSMLLLDLDLPLIDGFHFLTWLQKEPRLQGLPVVVLSGSDTAANLERAYGLGAVDYLVKPHNPQELLPMVRKLEQLWYRLEAASVARRDSALPNVT